MDGQVVFDFDHMQKNLQTLEEYYEAFYEAVDAMDIEVAQTLQISAESAIYGDRGKKVYDVWVNKCAPLKNFYSLFREWSAKVTEAFKTYADLQLAARDGDETGKLVYDEIETKIDIDPNSAANARTLAALEAGVLVVYGADGKESTIYVQGTPGNQYVEVDGQRIPITVMDGQITAVTIDGVTYNFSGQNYDQQAASLMQQFANDPAGLAQIERELRTSSDPRDVELLNALQNQRTNANLVSADQAIASAEQAILAGDTGSMSLDWPPEGTQNRGDQLNYNALDVLSTCTEEYAQLYTAVPIILESPEFQQLQAENPAAAEAIMQKLQDSTNGCAQVYNYLPEQCHTDWVLPDGAIADIRETDNCHQGSMPNAEKAVDRTNGYLEGITSVDSLDTMLAYYGVPTIAETCGAHPEYTRFEHYSEYVGRDSFLDNKFLGI